MRLGVLASGGLGFECLKHLSQRIKPALVACDSNSSDIIDFAKERGIPLFVGNPRNGKLAQALGEEPLDLILSINYLFLIEADVLARTLKAINFHGSLLPKYRGRTPHVWAIINGESETGVTAHTIDEGCDTGNIVLQEKVPVSDNNTGADILKAYAALYPALIDRVIDLVTSGTLKETPQNHDLATYYGKRTPADGQINWNWHKERIRNWVRAQSDPYPGAFSYIRDEKIVIDEVTVKDFGYNNDLHENGQVIGFRQDKPLVKVPNGVLELTTIRNDIQLQLNDILVYAN